jgi:small-conductance mechanosensitive channel
MMMQEYEGDVKDFGLNFTVNDSKGKEVNLIPLGSTIEVTNQNKNRYIYEVANYKLNQ